jgi:SAM-dependent methyltransferase
MTNFIRKKPPEERRFDTTSLREAQHGRIVHRDYLAHVFRWGFARRLIKAKQKVLDVGCGVDTPLARVLFRGTMFVDCTYVGVDLNPLKPTDHQRITLYEKTDFIKTHKIFKRGEFDVVTNFEVIEHMAPRDGAKLLAALSYCLKPGGTLLLSTPVFNGKAAANHIHEWKIPELQKVIERAGFVVERRWGTFASYNDLKRELKQDKEDMRIEATAELMVLARLREFYDDDVAACFLAPHHPDASRNNLWQCKKERS